MNQLEVIQQTSEFVDVEHPVITIDGIPFDVYLHRCYPVHFF